MLSCPCCRDTGSNLRAAPWACHKAYRETNPAKVPDMTRVVLVSYTLPDTSHRTNNTPSGTTRPYPVLPIGRTETQKRRAPVTATAGSGRRSMRLGPLREFKIQPLGVGLPRLHKRSTQFRDWTASTIQREENEMRTTETSRLSHQAIDPHRGLP